MKKPKLYDYGLTEEIISSHEIQVSEYKQIKQNLEKTEKENSRYNINLVVIISVFVILAFVAYIKVLLQAEDASFFILMIAIINSVILYLLLCKPLYYKQGISIYASACICLALSTFLPIISIGGAIYMLLKRNIQDVDKTHPPEKYYSISVEKSIKAYRKAVQEFNSWQEKCQRDYWLYMDGYEFEDAVRELYSEQGYFARRTSYSGDGGVDIILIKDGVKLAVQCKHHTKPIGPHDVRALMGVVVSKDFNGGIFVSLNGFTSTVYDEIRASKIPIQLVSLDDILSMVKYDEPKKKSTRKTRKITEKQIHLTKKQIVYHKTFNQGYIKEVLDNTVIIQFDGFDKSFKYPDAFIEGFLSLKPIEIAKRKETDKTDNLTPKQSITETKVKKVCIGNCSTCKRDHCIEDN